MKLPLSDMIYASFSLPFCKPNKFNRFWSNIEQASNKGGVFAGTFFGIKDDWYQMQADITFHRRDEIEAIFNSYTIVEIKERQYDGECVNKNGKVINKHWHVYEVIAIKK